MAKPTDLMRKPTAIMTGADNDATSVPVTIGTVIDEYHIDKVIADNTGEAAIYLATRDDKKFVAKIYHRGKKPKPELVQKIKSIQSPHIITVIYDCQFGDRHCEILPYYENGDLEKASPMAPEFIKNVVVPNINEGLKILHGNEIVHKDIKPNNLYLGDDSLHVVIGDFGISSIVDTGISFRYSGLSRTLGYSPPEASAGIVSKKWDYYSMGITLLHLVTGIDPFAGMNDRQIVLETAVNSLVIPESVDSGLAKLIKGLTLKAPEDRWGYDEVRRWCNNEEIEIKEYNQPANTIPTYYFSGKEYNNSYDLANAIAHNWAEGIKHMKRGLLYEHFRKINQDLASKIYDCSELRQPDLGLMKLIYHLKPDSTLCWRGKTFADLKTFGASLSMKITEISRDSSEILYLGGLQQYLELNGFGDELIKIINELQTQAASEPSLAYFRLVRLLNDNQEFIYKDQTFTDPDQLVAYLFEKRSRINSIADDLLKNVDFQAWLTHLGFGEHISEWRKISYE